MSGLVEASWNNNNEECRCSELSHLLDNESLHTEAIQNGRPKFLLLFFLKELKKTVTFQIPKTQNFFSWLKNLNRNFCSASSALSFLRIIFSLHPLIQKP